MWKIVITTIIENRGKTAVADKSAWDCPSLDDRFDREYTTIELEGYCRG